MGDCGTLVWVSVALAAVVGIAAWYVGRLVARMREPSAWPILGVIVVSLVVLQIGTRLAVLVGAIYERSGMDPAAVCGGKLAGHSFTATAIIIAVYVFTFFISFVTARKKVAG